MWGWTLRCQVPMRLYGRWRGGASMRLHNQWAGGVVSLSMGVQPSSSGRPELERGVLFRPLSSVSVVTGVLAA